MNINGLKTIGGAIPISQPRCGEFLGPFPLFSISYQISKMVAVADETTENGTLEPVFYFFRTSFKRCWKGAAG